MKYTFFLILLFLYAGLFSDEITHPVKAIQKPEIEFELVNSAFDDQNRVHLIFNLIFKDEKSSNKLPPVTILRDKDKIQAEKLKLVKKSREGQPEKNQPISYKSTYELIDEIPKSPNQEISRNADLLYQIKIYQDQNSLAENKPLIQKTVKVQKNSTHIKSSTKLGTLALNGISPQSLIDFQNQAVRIIRKLSYSDDLPRKLGNWQVQWKNYQHYPEASSRLFHALSDLEQIFLYRYEFLLQAQDKTTWEQRFQQLNQALLPFSPDFKKLEKSTYHSIRDWERKYELLIGRIPSPQAILKTISGHKKINTMKKTEKWDYQYFILNCCTAGHYMIDKLRKESDKAEDFFALFHAAYKQLNKIQKTELASAMEIQSEILDCFYYACSASRLRMEFQHQNEAP